MKVQLENAYMDLCEGYHTNPQESFLQSLRNTYASPGGEVFIDASSVEGEHFCIFADLLHLLLKQPTTFIRPTIVQSRATSLAPPPSDTAGDVASRSVYYAVPPRLLRLKLKLSRNTNNEDIVRICELIDVQKELRCVPVRIPNGGSLLEHGNPTEPLAQLTWPEKAVLECVDLCDAVFVSLSGGRALRTAARRNTYLLHVFLDGCSVNAAVVEQVKEATRQNRLRFRTAYQPL